MNYLLCICFNYIICVIYGKVRFRLRVRKGKEMFFKKYYLFSKYVYELFIMYLFWLYYFV